MTLVTSPRTAFPPSWPPGSKMTRRWPHDFICSRAITDMLISLREDYSWRPRRVAPDYSRSWLAPSMRLHRLRADDAFDAVQRPAAHLMTEELARRVVSILGWRRSGRCGQLRFQTSRIVSALWEETRAAGSFCRELNEERKRRGPTQFDEQLVEDATARHPVELLLRLCV